MKRMRWLLWLLITLVVFAILGCFIGYFFSDAEPPDVWPAETVAYGEGYMLLAGLDAQQVDEQRLLGQWRMDPPPDDADLYQPAHQTLMFPWLNHCDLFHVSCLSFWSQTPAKAEQMAVVQQRVPMLLKWLAAVPGAVSFYDAQRQLGHWPLASAQALFRLRQWALFMRLPQQGSAAIAQQLANDIEALRRWLTTGTDAKVRRFVTSLLMQHLQFIATLIDYQPQYRSAFQSILLPVLTPLTPQQRSLAGVSHHQLVQLGNTTRQATQIGLAKALGWSQPMSGWLQQVFYRPNRTLAAAMDWREQLVSLSEQVTYPAALADQVARLKRWQRRWWQLDNVAGAMMLDAIFGNFDDDLYQT